MRSANFRKPLSVPATIFFCTCLLSVALAVITAAPAVGCEGAGCPQIAPEPISAALFAAGAGVLVVRRYLKRRK